MIRAQRAAHRIAWIVLAAIVTPVLVLAFSDRPQRPRGADPALPLSAPAAEVTGRAAKNGCAPALEERGVTSSWSGHQGHREISFSVASSFALPETLIYAAKSEAMGDAPPDDARLLGVAVAGASFVAALEAGEEHLLLFCLPRQEIVAQDRVVGMEAAR